MFKKKSYLLLTLFAVVVCMISCEKNGSYCTVSPGTDTAIFTDNGALSIFTNCTSDWEAKVTAIRDSRCPTGVVCFWAGHLDIDLQINEGFNIKLDKGVQKDTTYRGRQYSLTLVDVTPYPGAGQSGQAVKTFIRIVRQ